MIGEFEERVSKAPMTIALLANLFSMTLHSSFTMNHVD